MDKTSPWEKLQMAAVILRSADELFRTAEKAHKAAQSLMDSFDVEELLEAIHADSQPTPPN